MSSKLLLDDDNYGDEYEPSDSEDEYTEYDKKLLNKVRKGNSKSVNSEREVLAFDENESDADDIEDENDLDDSEEADDIIDSKAWGKKKSAYYNTDFIDEDYSTYNEKEAELALQEEAEAKAIQQRLAKQLDEADFSLDLISFNSEKKEHIESDLVVNEKEEIKLTSDLSALTAQEKEQLFRKDSPEFEGIVQDFQKYISDINEILNPILKYCEHQSIDDLPILKYVKVRKNVSLSYCTNIAFYFMLKAKRISIKNHPITKRLVQLKQLLRHLDTKYGEVIKPQLTNIIHAINSGDQFSLSVKTSTKEVGVGSKEKNQLKNNYNISEDTETENDVNMLEANNELMDEDGEDLSEERRAITYQMAKNKGLTPSRKRDLRNPRVKHRKKYRKAIIRRKGAIRTVRKELKRYGGEISGIKATVKKGIEI